MHVLTAKCTFQHCPDNQSIVFQFSVCLMIVLCYSYSSDNNGTARLPVISINEKEKEYLNRGRYIFVIHKRYALYYVTLSLYYVTFITTIYRIECYSLVAVILYKRNRLPSIRAINNSARNNDLSFPRGIMFLHYHMKIFRKLLSTRIIV